MYYYWVLEFIIKVYFILSGIMCSIADHITTNIPFTCYHLYGRNLQTKRHEISDCRYIYGPRNCVTNLARPGIMCPFHESSRRSDGSVLDDGKDNVS